MHLGFAQMPQKAMTTSYSSALSRSLLHMRLKRRRVSRSRSEDVSFGVGRRYQPGHLVAFCKKCNLCFIDTVLSWSGNPVYWIKEITRDPCTSTWLGTGRYPGGDPKSGCSARANAHSRCTCSTETSRESREGSCRFRGGLRRRGFLNE